VLSAFGSFIFQLFLGLIASLGVVVIMASIPALPAMTSHFGCSPSLSNWTITLAMIGSLICQFIWGPFSDRYGRKVTLLIGAGMAVLSSLLCYLSFNIEVVLVGRFLQGFSSGSGLIVVRAACREMYQGAYLNRVIAWILTVIPFCAGISPFIGDVAVRTFGWRTPFLFLVVYASALFVAIVLFFPELSPHKNFSQKKSLWKSYVFLLKDSLTVLFLTSSSFAYACFFVFIPSSPWVFQNAFHLNGQTLSWAMLAFPFGTFCGGFFQTVQGWRYNAMKMCFIAWGINLSSLAINWILLKIYPSCAFYIGLMMLFGGATSIFNAICVTYIMKRHETGVSGNLSSLVGVGQMLGSAVGTFCAGYTFLPTPVIECIIVLAVMSFISCVLAFKRMGYQEKLPVIRGVTV
jgi:DHA1 family bicyclomycin/chloramphenicol resistance-like MFS transporter